MASDLSSPDVPPPPSPSPAPAPGPATTSTTACAPSSSPQASVSTSTLSPHAASFVPRGRSKQERWNDNYPSASSSDGSPRSYRDIVLSSTGPASSAASAAAGAPEVVGASAAAAALLGAAVGASRGPTAVLQRAPPPRRHAYAQPRRAAATDAEGWQKFESRAARRRRRRVVRPRRPVPADLAGLCFNCFSPAHSAAQCRQKTRCFHCKALGHRSYVCPGATSCGGAGPRRQPAPRVPFWRRITSAPESAGALVSHPPEDLVRHEAEHHPGSRRRRRRRRPRNRRPSITARPVSPPADGSQQMVLPPEASRAVFISVIGEAAAAEELAAVIALRLGAEDDPLALRRASPASFLLVLPDGAAVARRVRSLPRS